MHPGTKTLHEKFTMLHILRGMKFRKLSVEFGLHQGQAPVLNYIWKHDGCTQKEIADCMMISPAAVAVSTKRMQKAGLLEKQTDEKNLRCNVLHLTRQGEEMVQRFERALREFEARILEGVSDEDQETAGRVMDQVIENFRRQENLVPESIICGKEGTPVYAEKTAPQSERI